MAKGFQVLVGLVIVTCLLLSIIKAEEDVQQQQRNLDNFNFGFSKRPSWSSQPSWSPSKVKAPSPAGPTKLPSRSGFNLISLVASLIGTFLPDKDSHSPSKTSAASPSSSASQTSSVSQSASVSLSSSVSLSASVSLSSSVSQSSSVSLSSSVSQSSSASLTSVPSLTSSVSLSLSPSPFPPCPTVTEIDNPTLNDITFGNICTAPSANFSLTYVGGGGLGIGNGGGGGGEGGVAVSPVDAGSVVIFNVTVGRGGDQVESVNSSRTEVSITYFSGGILRTASLTGYRGGNVQGISGMPGGGGGGAGSDEDGGDVEMYERMGGAGGAGAAPGGKGDDDEGGTPVNTVGNGTSAVLPFLGIGELTVYSGGGGGSRTVGGTAVGRVGGRNILGGGGGGASFLANGGEPNGPAAVRGAGSGGGFGSTGGGGYFRLAFN